jgi:cholesterol transport system auxiliary component
MIAFRPALPACIALVCVSACSSGFRSDAPVPQTYVLRAAQRALEPLAQPASLQVLRPRPHPGLESDAIMLLRSDRRLDHFRAVRWAAELPEVIEALALDSFRNAGVFAAVHDSNSGFSAEYLLRITIRRFEADYTQGNGAPSVHVALDCTLGRRSDRGVLASFVAEGTADAEANRVSAVIGAFERAAAAAFEAMTVQTREAVAAEESRQPSAFSLQPDRDKSAFRPVAVRPEG